METIKLQVDEGTWSKAKQVAEARHCTVEDLIRELIDQLTTAAATKDPLWGMMADEPDLMDQVLDSALRARSEDALR
jgi:predicted DNA-binding ribbon-helix-helix protein